jgi:cytochrome c peroxidase
MRSPCELRTLYDGYDSLNDIGIGGAPVKRAAPSLWNVAFLAKFFWEARASTLEEQTR